MSRPQIEGGSLRPWLIAMERRRRGWKLLDTLARTLMVGAVAVGVLIASDSAITLPTWSRAGVILLLLSSALGVLGSATVRCLWRIDPVASACAIERHRPELDERLITLAGELRQADPRIERQLRADVTRVLKNDPLYVAWPIRRTAVSVVGSLLLMAGLSLTVEKLGWASQAARSLMPWSAIAPSNARLTLAVSSEVSRAGSPVTIEADNQGAGDDEPVVLHVTDASGEAAIAMVPQGQNRFVRTLSKLLQSAEVYATAGEARSRSIRISVATK